MDEYIGFVSLFGQSGETLTCAVTEELPTEEQDPELELDFNPEPNLRTWD